MKLKRCLCVIGLLSIPYAIMAQKDTYTIKGKVTDIENEPLPGVYITTGNLGAQTNYKGEYLIKNIPVGKVKLSSMYYSAFSPVSHEFDLCKDTTIIFTLKEDALNLQEVVVTGTRTEKRLSETPILTTLIKDREIRKAGAVSALESLMDNIPGIVISPNAMGNNMRIKGLNSRYILFLVDGERMVSEGAGGNVNLDQIDVNTIDRIEVINGAASALYGSNAMGAVINIITKKPAHRIEAGANVINESYNTWKTKVEVGSKLNAFATRLSAFRHSSDGFGGDGKGSYAARYEDWGTTLNLAYTPSPRTTVNANGRYFRHEIFNPVNSMNVTHKLTHTLAAGANGQYTSADKRNTMRLSVNWDKYFDYRVMEKKDNATEKQNTADYISSRFINTFNANKTLELIGGIEYNHEQIYAIKTLGSTPTTRSINDANVFGQADWKILSNFDLVVGARYTYNEQFKSAFTPKLALMYDLAGLKFRGSIGSGFRAPSIKELYYDFDHQGMFWVYGNPDLKAEKGLYSSLSVEYTKGSFNTSVSGYYNNINNKITQYDVINTIGGKEKYYKNVSSATLKGVDINASYVFFRNFLLKGNYSYCDATDNSTKLQLESNVKHSGTISLTWNGKIIRSPFSLQLAGRMTSPILYQEIITSDDGSETTDYSQSKAYHIWKIVLVKPFRLNKHTLEFTAKCDNLFGFKDASFINPGRQYMVGLRYAFK